MVADHFPPNVRRSMLAGDLDINDENAERYARSADALLAMIRRLHQAGVPLVAGTDALAGFTLHRELELYAKAGIANADVLHLATIGSAEVVGDRRSHRSYCAWLRCRPHRPRWQSAGGYQRNSQCSNDAVRQIACTGRPRFIARSGIEPFTEPVNLPED